MPSYTLYYYCKEYKFKCVNKSCAVEPGKMSGKV